MQEQRGSGFRLYDVFWAAGGRSHGVCLRHLSRPPFGPLDPVIAIAQEFAG